MLGRRQVTSSVLLSLTLALSASLLGCGPGNEPKRANVQAGTMPSGEEWNGVYYSQLYGYLHLVSDNRTASGAWRNTAGDAWGEMSGQCEGDLFKYEWTERKIGAIGADATKKGHGYFKYTKPKPDEAAKIVGQWGLGESDAGNPWEAVKQIRMEPKPESVRPDEIEGRTNVGGWDEEGGEKPTDSGSEEKKSE